ncbi:bap28 [Perkinsela sp. CCAP 1560/4]|nr:bap28 [Perkinsela sp. CCAP 1560/4]|eukprot:KNH08350.1 bap28 [Perkinsela sp. CCAP 1560/4]
MSTLLQQLQTHGGGTKNSQSSHRKQPSLLFDDITARTVTLEQFHDIGLKGLHGLIQLNTNFSSYQNTVFKESFMKIDREVASKEYNEAINESIRIFLSLLSPYFLYTHAHYCLEYLLQVFHIHQHSAEELLRCVLPYHEHVLFVRVLQLIPLHKIPLWSFLEANCQSGTPLDTGLLVDKALMNPNVLVVASQIVDNSATQNSLSNTLLAFWTVLTTRLISRKSMGEAHIKIILTMVKKGLFSTNENWFSSSLLIVMSLVNHITMTQTLLEDLTELLCAKMRDVLDQGRSVQHTTLTLQNSTLYTLYYTLTYLVGHAGQSGGTFSEDLKSKWWCTMSMFMTAGSNKEVLTVLKDELSKKNYACDLLNLAIESMLSSSTMCNDSNVWILEECIKTGIVKLSSTEERKDGLFDAICTFSLAAIQKLWLSKEFSEENTFTHPSLAMLSFLKGNYAHIFNSHIEKLQADQSLAKFHSFVIDRISQLPSSKGTSNGLLFSASEIGEWDGDVSPAELIALFSDDIFHQRDELQVDEIVSLLNRQRAALEKITLCEASNTLDWAPITPIVGDWHHKGLIEILHLIRHRKFDTSQCASMLFQFWNVFSLANANTSPFVAHQSSATAYKNICTGVRVACSVLRYMATEIADVKTLPSEVQLLGAEFYDVFPPQAESYADSSCRSVVNQVSSTFYKLFQPTMRDLLDGSIEAFKGLYGVDKAMAHFLLFHCIRYSKGQYLSKERQASLLDIFCDAYVEGHVSVDSTNANTWRDLLVDGFSDESDNMTKNSNVGRLWHFGFMELLKLNDSFWLTKKVTNQICEIYAAKTQPTLFHEAVRQVTSDSPAKHSFSSLVDGIFLHRPQAQHLQHIVGEITSYFCSDIHKLSEVETMRILLVFVVGISEQIQLKAFDSIDSGCCEIIKKRKSNLEDGKRTLLDFVTTVLSTLSKGESLASAINDTEKILFRNVLDQLHTYVLNELSHSLSDAQKAILVHSYYTMAKFFIPICSQEESIAQFLLKAQSKEQTTEEGSLRSLFATGFAKLQQMVPLNSIPCELMLHRILSANYESAEESTAVIHGLNIFAKSRSIHRASCFLDEFCPQEYPDVSVRNLILVACHLLLQNKTDSAITGDAFTELVELFLLVRPSAVTTSSFVFERKFQSFSWEYLWKNYASQLLELCHRQLQTTICRETIVLLLEAIHSGIPYIAESQISELDKTREFVIADLRHIMARMCAKAPEESEMTADDKKVALLNSSAEVEMRILRDLGMDSDAVENVAWVFFHSSRSSRQVERLAMELLMTGWKSEADTSAHESRKFDVADCCQKAESVFQMLTTNTRFPSHSLNVVLSHLGELLGDVVAGKSSHKVATSLDFIQKILRSKCFPFPMNNFIFLACLSYAHDNRGTSAIMDILHSFMRELSREAICQQISSLLQITESFSSQKGRKRVKSDDLENSNTFVQFLSQQFFASLLSGFGQKVDAVQRENPQAITQCELRLIADSCNRCAPNDDFLVQLGKLFSANEIVSACIQLLESTERSSKININTLSWFFQISLAEKNTQEIDDELFHSFVASLYKKLIGDSKKHGTALWLNKYHSIMGIMSCLFEHTSPTTFLDTAKLNIDRKLLPNFDAYFDELHKQHTAAVDPVAQQRSTDLLCVSLRVMSRVFHALPQHEQIRLINYYCGVIFGRAMTDSTRTSDTLVRTLLSIVGRLFGSSDVITGTVRTVAIYSDLLCTLAYCSVNTTNEDNTSQTCMIALWEAISGKLDMAVLFQGFERKCKSLMQPAASAKSQSGVNFQAVVHQAVDVLMGIVQCKLHSTVTFERKDLEMWIRCLQRFTNTTMAFIFQQTELESAQEIPFVFFRNASENIVKLILFVMSKTSNSMKQFFLTKLIGFLDVEVFAEDVLNSPLHKQEGVFCELSMRSLILSNLCNRMLHEFGEFGVKFFYHCEESLKRFLRFAERSDWPWYTSFQPIVKDILEGSLGQSSHQPSNGDFIMSMTGEIIILTADSIDCISEIPSGSQWIDNSCVQGADSTIYHIAQIYTNPIWQKFSVSMCVPPPASLEKHMTKHYSRKVGETLTETLHKVLAADADVIKRAKLVQDALLQGICENSVVNAIQNTKLRAQVFDALRCETICLIERIYRTVGQPMNVLLRDVLVQFTKFMDDKNPVVKSLARKALHSMAEAVGLSIEMVMEAL